jgi:hypothetical protein
VLEDLAERPPVILQPPRERPTRVDLDGVEQWANPFRRPGQPDAERIAERMRGIGRDDEDAVARGGSGDGVCRGARRLADAAFASEEQKVRSQNF